MGWTIVGDFELSGVGGRRGDRAVHALVPVAARQHHRRLLHRQAPPTRRNARLDRLGALLLALRDGADGLAHRDRRPQRLEQSQSGSMMLGFPDWIVYVGMVPPLALCAADRRWCRRVRGFEPEAAGMSPLDADAADLRRHAGADGAAHAHRDRDVRRRRGRLSAAGRLAAAGQLPQHAGLRALCQLRPVRDPAVHPDGQLRHAGRHLEGAVRSLRRP